MREPRTLEEVPTPAAVIDLDRMAANLDRMAHYTSEAGLSLRPHCKTHKTPQLAREQLRRGAVGITVATIREAEVLSSVADDILLAYPPVGPHKLERLLSLPEQVQLTVAVDSTEALNLLGRAARERDRKLRVLIEIDAGMHRVGVAEPAAAAGLASTVQDHANLEFAGLLFYPGHIREHVDAQMQSIDQLAQTLQDHLSALERAGLKANVVSGGSTPAAFGSHLIPGLTEIRPGTYIFNDRTTAAIGACDWDDCAYTVLATVVSTSVAGQAVVDAGSKALSRDDIRGSDAPGFGALLDRPDVFVKALSEEHGLLDLSHTDWRPRVGDYVRIVPNHVCVSVNLIGRLWGIRGSTVESHWDLQARGWSS